MAHIGSIGLMRFLGFLGLIGFIELVGKYIGPRAYRLTGFIGYKAQGLRILGLELRGWRLV